MQNRVREIMDRRIWIFAGLGGTLFAAFDRCGFMLRHYGSIWGISENPWHRTVFHRILLRLPVSVLAVWLLLFLTDRLLNNRNAAGKRFPRYADQSGSCVYGERNTGRKGSFADVWDCLFQSRYWFPTAWLIFLTSFLPAFLGGYPGLFAADAPNQVGWTFSGWLTAHHPLLHTGILCGIFSGVRAAGLSDNTAAALYTVLQMFLLSGIFAWILRFLREEKAPVWLQTGTCVWLCLVPFHGLMAIYTTKDTLFSGVFVLCVMEIFRMCGKPGVYFTGWRRVLRGGGCFVLLFLLRNNGFHTLVLCVPFMLFLLRQYWRKFLLLFLGLLLMYQFYSGPFLKLIHAEPGNAREAYSILMQTLGRTYVAAGDIRPEEMEVIRPVLDEEALAQYTPDLSDPVKNQFHTEAFNAKRTEFIRTWLLVGWRNKKIYVDAFLNTTCAFWYPGAWGEYLEFVCFDIEEENPAYPHVHMRPLVPAFYRYYTSVGTDASFRQVPFVRELLSMGGYFWLMVYAGLYVIYRRDYIRLIWMLPFWTYMGTSFLGPAALLRYAYPVMLGAPLLICFLVVNRDRT